MGVCEFVKVSSVRVMRNSHHTKGWGKFRKSENVRPGINVRSCKNPEFGYFLVTLNLLGAPSNDTLLGYSHGLLLNNIYGNPRRLEADKQSRSPVQGIQRSHAGERIC